MPVSAGVREAVGVTIQELFCGANDWFFVCSRAVLNECLNGTGVKRRQLWQAAMARVAHVFVIGGAQVYREALACTTRARTKRL